MPPENNFNPDLFEYDPSQAYAWHVFPKVTLAIITWNRLEYTEKLINSLLRYTHLPHEYLIIDNGSDDGTADFLRNLEAEHPNVRLVLNRKNLGKSRALAQIQDAVSDGLIVFFDNDVELLSNYWLLHVQKAFHAYRLQAGNTEIGLGIRLTNCDEYGFRYATNREIFEIPTAQNDLPRTSFAATSKDDPDQDRILDETVVVGWSDFLTGNSVISVPASLYKKMAMQDQYPKFIGGVDSYFSKQVTNFGGKLGYIENGPIARHNDWPYTNEKAAAYKSLMGKRAANDMYYVRWKFRDVLRRLLGK